jgi:hypothetical protein
MKKVLSGFLSLALASTLTIAMSSVQTANAAQKQIPVSHLLSDNISQEITGAGPWSQFFSGVSCGVGIVGIAVAASSGVGVFAVVVAGSGVAAACVKAVE